MKLYMRIVMWFNALCAIVNIAFALGGYSYQAMHWAIAALNIGVVAFYVYVRAS